MPEGSSSAAPVISPGPRFFKKFVRRLDRWVLEGRACNCLFGLGTSHLTIGICRCVGVQKGRAENSALPFDASGEAEVTL